MNHTSNVCNLPINCNLTSQLIPVQGCLLTIHPKRKWPSEGAPPNRALETAFPVEGAFCLAALSFLIIQLKLHWIQLHTVQQEPLKPIQTLCPISQQLHPHPPCWCCYSSTAHWPPHHPCHGEPTQFSIPCQPYTLHWPSTPCWPSTPYQPFKYEPDWLSKPPIHSWPLCSSPSKLDCHARTTFHFNTKQPVGWDLHDHLNGIECHCWKNFMMKLI